MPRVVVANGHMFLPETVALDIVCCGMYIL